MIILPPEMTTVRSNPEYNQGFTDGFNDAVAELAKQLQDAGIEFKWAQEKAA